MEITSVRGFSFLAPNPGDSERKMTMAPTMIRR
jgi:hypothetical protein